MANDARDRLAIATTILREAGAVALRAFHERPREAPITFNGRQDYASATDSEVEALTLAGTGNVGDAASRLKQLGPQTIVITRAEHGVLLLTGDSPPVEIAVPTVDPVDSTGAGDAFCGAFAAVHLATGDPFAAIEAAAGAARIAIGAFGIDGLLAAATARTAATQGVRR